MVGACVRSVETAVAAGEIIGLYIALAHRSAVDTHGKMSINAFGQAFFAEGRRCIMAQAYLRHCLFSKNLVNILGCESFAVGRYFYHLLFGAVVAAAVPKDGKKRRRTAEDLKNMQTVGRSGVLIDLRKLSERSVYEFITK